MKTGPNRGMMQNTSSRMRFTIVATTTVGQTSVPTMSVPRPCTWLRHLARCESALRSDLEILLV